MGVEAANQADTQPATQPDAASVETDGLPRRKLRGTDGRASIFQAVFAPAALDRLHAHGRSRTDVEVCGVLVGRLFRDGVGPYLLVADALPGTAADSRGTQVTFTAETWDTINAALDARREKHPDDGIVGWYHTHPGFGIFLSGMDLFIHDNFFNLPHQVAFVYDPKGGDEGCFVWRGGRAEREPFLTDSWHGRPARDLDDEQEKSHNAGATPVPLAEEITPTKLARLRSWIDFDRASSTPPPGHGVGALRHPAEPVLLEPGRRRRRMLLVTAALFVVAFAAVYLAMDLLERLAPPPPVDVLLDVSAVNCPTLPTGFVSR